MKKFLFLLFLVSATTQAQFLDPSEPIRFLALGDSYTIGQSVSPEQRWPRQLLDSLVLRGFTEDTLKIIATTGWRTDNLIQAISQQPLAPPYTLVSLLIGVNNQYQNRPISQYTTEFPQLLDSAIHLAGGNPERVFVVSIPDYAFTPYGQGANPAQITAGINQYNQVNKDLTLERGIAYFDITEISRQGVIEPGLVAADGLHPSGLQYTRWVSKILDRIDSVLVLSISPKNKPRKEMQIFPVPTSGWITLPYMENQTEIVCFGSDGKSYNRYFQPERKIWVGDLPKGVYRMQLNTRNGKEIWKLVKD
jgi:lysophospholipase L1-like esterase